MEIPYRQLEPREALKVYCDWLLEQRTDDFFRVFERGRPMYEWYMVFYPVRTLLLGGKLLNEPKYIEAALKYVDIYLTEQLPNGGFTSTYRRTPTASLTKSQIKEVMRTANVNLADNGSNVLAIVQASEYVTGKKRQKYLDAARKWFDDWVCIWVLPEGGFNNGLWGGRPSEGPYTCAIGTTSAALAAFGRVTGEYEYIETAENAIRFQCNHWLDDGRPINFDSYSYPHEQVLTDFGHTFYLLEGMTWTHSVTKDEELKKLIEERMRQWIFGEKGILTQWGDSWFNFMVVAVPWEKLPEGMIASRMSHIRLGWEMAKSNGIISQFLYYLDNIEDNPVLREKTERALKYLCHPLKCRASGVMSDPEESYGAFAVQSTGFAGLSLSQAIKKNSVYLMD